MRGERRGRGCRYIYLSIVINPTHILDPIKNMNENLGSTIMFESIYFLLLLCTK